MRLTHSLGVLLIVVGVACLALVGIRLGEASSFQHEANRRLDRMLAAPAPVTSPAPEPTASSNSSDAPAPAPPPEDALVGRLEVPRLKLSAIVVQGEDDATLSRAVGHLEGTALPWERGNAVLAGHRDTFFRPLQHIRVGDAIRMTTPRGSFDYRVVGTEVVDPDDVSVLAPTPERALTLVTCYPFVYVGTAPQRFIVHAR